MGKQSPLELAKAFLKYAESKGEVYKETTVPDDIGVGMCESLVIVQDAKKIDLGEEEVVAYVDHWQKEQNLALTKATVKKVAEEVRHYAKEKA